MLEKIKEINDKLIIKYTNTELEKKYLLIKDILNEPNAFLKMDAGVAYSILKDLGIKNENIKNVYMELI